MSDAPLRFGLLGAGWFGREAHLRNLVAMPESEVVAVSSRSTSSLEAAQKIGGNGLATTTEWREVLERDDLDAVIVAMTNDRHAEVATAAFEAGKHVMLEKPLGLTLAECDQVIAAAEASGKILQVGHEMRFQRLYEETKRRVDAGAIGELQLMWCREFRGPMRDGWRASEALTGGTILEKNVHHLDLFNWFMDARPLKVAAFGGTNVLRDREILDNAQVLIEYEGGKRATLELCLFAPMGGETEIGLAGSSGRIDSENQALRLVQHRYDSETREDVRIPESDEEANFVDGSGRVDRGIRPELEHFCECVRTGHPPVNDGASAREAVALCLAAQASILRGEVVDMEEFAG